MQTMGPGAARFFNRACILCDTLALVMDKPKTWFEKRSRERMRDPRYAAAYRKARAEIAAVDALVRELDAERRRQGMSKAELAKRSALPAMSVRRLFTVEAPDPKLSTIVPISLALGCRLSLVAAVARASPPVPAAARVAQARKESRRGEAAPQG